MISRFKSLLGRLRTAPPETAGPPSPPPPTLADELREWEQTVSTFAAGRRAQPARLYSSLRDETLRTLVDRYPAQVAATVAAADRVCRHQFDLLGSGPFVPSDPGRPQRGHYQPIDWYIDPIQNLRFPERIPHKSWNLLEMRPGLADVKLPWELGRCQHWLPLAQAFAIERKEKYALEILDQHDDFLEANPVGLGIQWTCTMDVAIRALNWAMALELIQSDPSVPTDRLERMYASLFDHGTFIERNLENTYEVTSNHFLSNVVGLFGLGLLFSELPSGGRWLVLCRGWLEQEMRVQVLPDGCDYESSVPYHRLVAELFFSGWRMAQVMGLPLSNAYESKLRLMIYFLDAVLRPDGKLPQFGDADDGRVHVFSDYGHWDPQDARHLLAPAAAAFDRPEWVASSDPWAPWETAWWGLKPLAPAEARPPRMQRLFPDAGLALVKDERDYLLISNGKVGTNGFGNHKHNDLLSFEFHSGGVPLIVDPGSYVYTSNPAERNRFRSTSAHNTVVVDEQEQNEFKSEWLFRMFEKAKPEHIAFEPSDRMTKYRGKHDGYARLTPRVMHEREWRLDHSTGTLEIDDLILGEGTHRLRWSFHCAPGVEVTTGPGTAMLAAGGRRWRLRADESLHAAVESGWYSPSYGVRKPNVVIVFSTEVDVSLRQQWSFVIEGDR